MKELKELNSEDCLANGLGTELATFASNILSSKSYSSQFLTVGFIKGQKLGMKVTFVQKGFYHLNFYDAYVRFIYDEIYLLLSDNSFFEGIGKSSHLMKIPSFNYNLPQKCYNDFKFDLEDAGKAKFDNKRQLLHSFLYKITTRLLVLHECQHILNGHTEFLKVNGGSAITAIKKGLLSHLDLHTFEMDADSVALQILTNHLLYKNNDIKIPEELNSEEGIIKSLIFIIFLLFIVLPRKQYNSLDEIKISTHPSNGCRFVMMMKTIRAKALHEKNEERINILNSEIKKITEQFKLTIKKISGEKIDLKEVQLFSNKEGLKYIDSIIYNWNYSRRKIEPYAIQILAPYTNDFIKNDLDFNSLLNNINMTRIGYVNLLFSHSTHIIKLANIEGFISSSEEINLLADNDGGGMINLTPKKLIELIDPSNLSSEEQFKNKCNILLMHNGQFLRTKALSELYKIIFEYFEKSKHLDKLNSLNWYRVLSTLDYHLSKKTNNITISFSEIYGISSLQLAFIQWNGIRIVEGQLFKDIKYNDKQVIELLETAYKFFETNKKEFNQA